jgi:DNA-directed RNA polymerase specialized sigma24 family protein
MEDVAGDGARARVPAEQDAAADAATVARPVRRRATVPQVVARVIRRRLPAFETFLEANRALVYRYLVAAVGPVDADDVFQETFLAALRAYPRCTEPDRLDRWVLRIASRKAIDHHRGAARRPVPVASPPDRPAAGFDPAADGLGPATRAVGELPSRQRDAVAYRHVLGFSVAETATLMGTTEDAVRANAYQGIKKLKERATWTND